VQSVPHEDWLTLRPVLGARSTWWDEGLGGEPVGRTLGQAGLDAEMTLTGTWDVDSPRWGVRGLRHTLRPFAGWRAFPEVDGDSAAVPRLDRRSEPDLNLPMLDLADRRDTDTIDERQAAQVGVRNSLETRDARHGTRETLRADLVMDWRDRRGSAASERGLHAHLAWKPTDWLSLETLARTAAQPDHGSGTLSWASLRSGDLWSLSLGYGEFGGAGPDHQVFGDLRLRLNSAFTLRLGSSYDLMGDGFLERQVTLTQKIGASWDLEYGLSARRTRDDDDSLGFTVRVRLFKF
jgi:hypothetical protein